MPRHRFLGAAFVCGAALPGVLTGQSAARPASVRTVPVRAAAVVLATDSAPARGGAAPAASPPRRPAARSVATVFAEVRSRSELERASGEPDVHATMLLRSRVGARAALGHGVRLVAGLQGDRLLDREAPPAAVAGAVDLYEGYVELAHPVAGAPAAVRVGRHEMAVGNERLLGRRNWSNSKHSFDGVRLFAGPGAAIGGTPAGGAPAGGAPAGWSASGFVVSPADPAPRAGGRVHAVAGLGLTHPLAGLAAATGEVTAFHERGVRARAYEVTGRTTLVGRVRAPRLGPLGAELETALQTGTRHALATATAAPGPDEAIAAWLVAGRLGTAARPGRRLTASLGLDLLSGDAPDSPGRHGAFDTMYGSNHAFYGAGDVAGGNPAATLRGRGLADAFVTTTLAATRRASLRVDGHRMRPMRGAGLLGYEADVIAPVRLVAGTTLELGWTAFRAGPAGAAVGLGPAGAVRRWGYVQLTAAR
jgi:hypothetical protein